MSFLDNRWLSSDEAMPVLAASGQHPVLASIASRSFFLIGELLLGNLSETVVVVGNAPLEKKLKPLAKDD
jgi:hypothetical protein